ncbi:MAG: ABC transporter permease [Phocaeicola sp.]
MNRFFNRIFRSLQRRGENNLLKVGVLGVGLAIGLILVAKIYFEQSYETHITDAARIYEVHCLEMKTDEPDRDLTQVSGGTVLGIKEFTPEVEVATRYTTLGDIQFQTDSNHNYEYKTILGDSCLFQLFGWRVLMGDATQILSTPSQALISQSKAKELGGDVIGQTLSMVNKPTVKVTIAGIYEDFPKSSKFRFDMVLSMPTIGQVTWDGSTNYLGNDRYMGYVKLIPQADNVRVQQGIDAMRAKYLPLEHFKKNGVDLTYTLHPLLSIHLADESVRRMNYILGFIAFALLATTLMNYILFVISIIINKSKEIAVQKCYGAESGTIYRLAFAETGTHFALALLLATLLLLALRGFIHNLLGVALPDLLTAPSVALLLAIFAGIFLLAGTTVGYLYAHTPVAAAFRQYKQNRRKWKQALMFTQLAASLFLLAMLSVVSKQYDRMIHDNPGYQYQNLAYTPLAGVDSLSCEKIIEELQRLPEVKSVTTLCQLPIKHPSGNNVFLPHTDKELFNIADMYYVGNGYLETMGMKIVQGNSFTEGIYNSQEIMVDEAFVQRAKEVLGWDDVIGKEIGISEHTHKASGPFFTICGVYQNIRLNTLSNQDMRPSVTFYNRHIAFYTVINFHELTPTALLKAEATIQQLITHRTVTLHSWALSMEKLYEADKQFKEAVTIGSIVALLIALIGLVGYTTDEMNRRRKEVAIRKVNGGELKDLQRIFLKDLFKFALPALLLGSLASYYVASLWLQQFSEKITLSWSLFVGCSVGLLLLLIVLQLYKLNKFIRESPVGALKSE